MRYNLTFLAVFIGFLAFSLTSVRGQPSVIGFSPSDTKITDSDVSGSLTFSITYDQDMDQTVDPNISFPAEDLTSTLDAGPAVSWTTSTTCDVTYSLSDADESFTDVDIEVADADNTSGTAQTLYSENDVFSIATTNPTATISVSPTLVTDATGSITFTVDYSEAMNTGVNPGISFPVESPGSTLNSSSNSWNSSTQYEAVYSVNDNNLNLQNVDLKVDGGESNDGNPQDPKTNADAFDIDMENPTVSSITKSTTTIIDGTVGSGFSITVVFDQDVQSGGGAPTFTYPTAGEKPMANTLNDNGGSWTATDTYKKDYTINDAGEEIQDIDVRVKDAEDANGNVMPDKDATNLFSIDTKNPSVSSISTNLSTITDADAGLENFSVTVTYDEEMTDDGSANPDISFPNGNPSSTLTFSSGTWNSTTEYVAKYDVADNDQNLANIDIEVNNGTDAAGNTQTTGSNNDAFSIDMDNPQVTGVTADIDPITDADDGGTLTVTFTFNQAMTTNVPTVDFPNESPGATLTSGGTSWAAGNTEFSQTYTISDNNLDLNNIDVRIDGAEDAQGNSMDAAHTKTDLFSIDMANPTVSSVNASTGLITDANAGAQNFTLTIDYSEAMDGGSTPAITFPTEVPTTTITHDAGNSSWLDADSYQAVYDVATTDEEKANVDIRVNGATDTDGNTQQQKDQANFFSIDTKNPAVTSITPNLNPITDANTGNGNFTITVQYDEAMIDDGTADPDVSFPVENPSSTLTLASKSWNTNTEFVATYDVADNDQNLANIDIEVNNGTDAAGNTQTTGSNNDAFSIDMDNPQVTGVTASIDPITDSDDGNTFTLEFTFDQPMTNNTPTVSFPNDNLGGTLSSGTSGWNAAEDVFSMNYTISDNNMDVSNIDVRIDGAEDKQGNPMDAAHTETDVFSIDMSNPQVVDVTPSSSTITDANVGSGTFSVTVEYDKTMNTGVNPSITYPTAGEDPSVAPTTLDDATKSHSWPNSTIYKATWDVADANEEITAIDVEVDGAEDTRGNPQSAKTSTDLYNVDTKNPNATVSYNIDPITDADAGGQFIVTVNYDEPMNTGISPDIIFPDESPASTLSFASGSWPSNTEYEAVYDVSDADQDFNGIDIRVKNAQDTAGNTQNQLDNANDFAIDMQNPTVTSFTVNHGTITDAEAGGQLIMTFGFSENMDDDGSDNPVITFPDATVSSTLTHNSYNWLDAQTCEVIYDITDANETISNIDVRLESATDVVGNTVVTYDEADKFSIDMANPYLDPLTITSDNANNSSLAKQGDKVTLSFTTSETAAANPTVNVDGNAATVNSLGSNNYTAEYTFSGGETEGVVNFEVSFTDTDGNPCDPDPHTNSEITDGSSVTYDETAPSNQDAVFGSDETVLGGKSVAISSSGDATNKVWFAPAGQTQETDFSAGSDMTQATDGTATSIDAPSDAGTYKLYVIDEAGNVSNESSATLTVDNTPIVDNIEGSNISYTENDPAVQVTSSITVDDDQTNLASAEISISANFENGDELQYSPVAGISGSWASASGVLTLTGSASLADYQAALRNVSYVHNTEKPTSNTRTMSFRVNDGSAWSAAETRDIDVTEVNDAPTFTSTPVTKGQEDQLYTYSIEVNDVDHTGGQLTITAPTMPGFSGENFTDNGDGTAELTGTPVDPITSPYSVKIKVEDDAGAVEYQTYDITVTDAYVVDDDGGADYSVIQNAVNNASDGDSIYVNDGTYGPFKYDGKNLVIYSSTAPANTIIETSGTTAVKVKDNSGSDVRLSGVTIRNGEGSMDADVQAGSDFSFNGYSGGGLLIYNSGFTGDNLVIEDNRAPYEDNIGGSGAGVFIGGGATVNLTDITIQNNIAEIYRGGGICIENSSIILDNAVIQNNSGGHYGGGISAWSSTVVIKGTSEIKNNQAPANNGQGGAMYLHHATVTFQDNTDLSGNSARRDGIKIYGIESTINGIGLINTSGIVMD